MKQAKEKTFTGYQVFIIAILAILQFTIVLDFMVLSPLGAILMPRLHITPSQFGVVVSAYAFSAGISGILAAGFADKYDRKKFLMFFYTGFIVGTILCAVAPNYPMLLAARIVTGIFGGVIGSVAFAIITDIFKMEMRGRVMGFVQMGFAASQILGIPIGLMLSNRFGWHAPFWMIAIFGVLIGAIVLLYMKPVTGHITGKSETNAFRHLLKTVSDSHYLQAFMTTTLLATGGFMLMPFGSAFGTSNLGLTMEQLPVLYGVTGIFSIVIGPLAGRASDKLGKFRMFAIGTTLSMAMVIIYTNLGITPLWMVIALNVVLFMGIMGRMIPAQALMTAIPVPQDRGAFMSVMSSVQQISGGVASAVAGLIVVQNNATGKLEHYDTLGYVVATTMLICVALMYNIDRLVMRRATAQSFPAPPATVEEPLIADAG